MNGELNIYHTVRGRCAPVNGMGNFIGCKKREKSLEVFAYPMESHRPLFFQRMHP